LTLTLAAVQKGIAIVMCLFQDGTELDAGGQMDDGCRKWDV